MPTTPPRHQSILRHRESHMGSIRTHSGLDNAKSRELEEMGTEVVASENTGFIPSAEMASPHDLCTVGDQIDCWAPEITPLVRTECPPQKKNPSWEEKMKRGVRIGPYGAACPCKAR